MQSPPLSAEFKNMWIYTSYHPPPLRSARVLWAWQRKFSLWNKLTKIVKTQKYAVQNQKMRVNLSFYLKLRTVTMFLCALVELWQTTRRHIWQDHNILAHQAWSTLRYSTKCLLTALPPLRWPLAVTITQPPRLTTPSYSNAGTLSDSLSSDYH